MGGFVGLQGLGQAQMGRDHQYWDAHIRRQTVSVIKRSDPVTYLKQELQNALDEYLKDWDK